MGVMSELYILAGHVLDGEAVESVASRTTYTEEQIDWATRERLKIEDDQ